MDMDTGMNETKAIVLVVIVNFYERLKYWRRKEPYEK